MRGSFVLTLFAFLAHYSWASGDQDEESRARAFLANYNQGMTKVENEYAVAIWNYETNLTVHNQDLKTQAKLQHSKYRASARENASKINVTKLSADSKRQIELIRQTAELKSLEDVKTRTELISKMDEIYGSGKVKDKDGKLLSLNPDLYEILSTSRDYEKLKLIWKGWRDAVGPKIKPLFKQFVDISNKGAKENNWKDNGEWWRSWYEVDDLEEIVEALYNDLKPLYEELHGYVRYRLSQHYPQVSSSGPIPAHLFGNMWAQNWANIFDLIEPYPNQSSLDVTPNMVKQGYTRERMVRLAESFFVSIGLKSLPDSFYNKSMIAKPKDREVVCHASAWDFMINQDVRIKQCTTITHEYLVTTHHELGHIQYFLQYWDQPYEYRTGANPGFHEAVGDTLSLSVDTPTHLKLIGLLPSVSNNTEADINTLMKMALSKVAFLPFGYMIDQWRWKVFRGEITPENYNKKWWEVRTKYQGIKPPVCRSENDFDPGAKYHIPANTPYIRYFISHVLQFQFHKAACQAANFTGPLFKCSIYNSTAAGKKLGAMLALGNSKPWPEALKAMVGTDKMDVSALKEYFKPLTDWLKQQRTANGYPIGWENKGAYEECSSSPSGVEVFGPARLVVLLSITMATIMNHLRS